MRADGTPSARGGRQRHRVGLGHLRLLRLGEPAGELDDRIVADVRLVEAGPGVVAAEIGDGHACKLTGRPAGPARPPRSAPPQKSSSRQPRARVPCDGTEGAIGRTYSSR